jgi:AraC family transcriptional regulator of arabinose operon
MGPRNHLHLWDDRFLYVTPEIHSGLTARSTTTLLLSAVGRPFRLAGLDGHALRCEAALVAPHVPRQLDVDGDGLLSLNLDPSSAACRAIAARIGRGGIEVLDPRRFGALRELFQPALDGTLDTPQLRRLSADLIDAVAEAPCGERELDPRVQRVMQALRDSVEPLPLARLSRIACLSPDRLTHLFAQQAGLSIKRYAVWSKMRRAMVQFGVGERLTEAALIGGFTDAAHMSRTFRNHFGLPPSFLARHVALNTHPPVKPAWEPALAAA